MGSINKQTFLAHLKCPKLAMYLEKFPHLTGSSVSNLPSENETHFKNAAYKLICELEGDEKTHVHRNKVFNTNDGAEVEADILIRRADETILVEVVCSTDLNDGPEFKWLAYKYYMMCRTNCKIDLIYIVKINGKYEEGKCISSDYLAVIDVTKKLKQQLHKIPKYIFDIENNKFQEGLFDVKKDAKCLEPNICPFKSHCWKDMPSEQGTVFEINGMPSYSKFLLYWNEVYKFEEIPKKRLDFRQDIQVRCEIQERARIKSDKIESWLSKVNSNGKIWYLYIGCIYPIKPIIHGTKPNIRIPFQFRLDYQRPDGNFTPYDFINATQDSSKIGQAFLEELLRKLELNKEAPIVVYDLERTKKCFSKLLAWNPNRKADIEAILNRLVDLQEVFYECWYYLPAFKGSYKLQDIVQILLPGISFTSLTIKNSHDAGEEFLHSMYKNSKLSQRQSDSLTNFGKMNTHCLKEIVKFLRTAV